MRQTRSGGLFDAQSRQERRDERLGLELINKRAGRVEKNTLGEFAMDGVINPLDNLMVKHAKLIGYVALESCHNTVFHFIETVKVRGQARNLVSGDISHYFQNSVEKKPLISGVVSGFFGAVAGAFTFLSIHDLLTI